MKPSVYTQIYQDGLLILKLGNEDLINGRSQRSDLKENRKKILSGAMRDKDLLTYSKPKIVSKKRA